MKMEIKKNVLKENINNLNEFLSHYDLQDFNTNIFVENAMEKMLGSNPNLSAKLLFIHIKSSYLMTGAGHKDLIMSFISGIFGGLLSPLLLKEYISMSEREERRMQEEHESDERSKQEKHESDERRKQEKHESDQRRKQEKHESDERRKQEEHEIYLRANNARIEKYNARIEKYNALTSALKQSELENNKSIISRTINYWYKPKDK